MSERWVVWYEDGNGLVSVWSTVCYQAMAECVAARLRAELSTGWAFVQRAV